MSQYLVLSHIKVQNANSIAGFTWGFPAVTSFLGFTHALSRKLAIAYEDINLSGCAIISNYIDNKVYQPKEYADFEFLQSKNPPVLAKHKSDSPPIIEEGKMNLTVSLVIEIEQPLSLTTQQLSEFIKQVNDTALELRLAGGTILGIGHIKLFSASTDSEQTKMRQSINRLVMPGFVLLDRSHYLQAHFAKFKEQDDTVTLFDAWLDYSALCYCARPKTSSGDIPNERTPADWEYQPKPQAGWLVPLMTGFKAISPLYDAGDVLATRDVTTPTRFVEAIHSVGEWKGAYSVNPDRAIWRYDYDGDWYRCTQNQQPYHSGNLGEKQVLTQQNNLVGSEDTADGFTLDITDEFNSF